MRQLLTDAAGIEIVVPAAEEPVLLGSAILGGVAGGAFATIADAMSAMTSFAEHVTPDPAQATHHDNRFELFCRFQSVARDAAQVTATSEDYASA